MTCRECRFLDDSRGLDLYGAGYFCKLTRIKVYNKYTGKYQYPSKPIQEVYGTDACKPQPATLWQSILRW